MTCSKAQGFFVLFLKLIKSSDILVSFDLDQLIDSIQKCISYEPNKVLFINENGMYNFYNYCRNHMTNITSKFWNLCIKIFEEVYVERSSLCPVKLTENVKEIMNNYSFHK
ncbi:hypothetical protein RF11_08721 [Thelohanellus kitauei]|uniref:Uncharacterized protein n=1 Tax=Thelohanellus kitauei TaxID=669202 RepID=A0A0C2MHC3_THEKT|nr:hypothetical protein RF11_08721 [Thelohanellus kitauei]